MNSDNFQYYQKLKKSIKFQIKYQANSRHHQRQIQIQENQGLDSPLRSKKVAQILEQQKESNQKKNKQLIQQFVSVSQKLGKIKVMTVNEYIEHLHKQWESHAIRNTDISTILYEQNQIIWWQNKILKSKHLEMICKLSGENELQKFQEYQQKQEEWKTYLREKWEYFSEQSPKTQALSKKKQFQMSSNHLTTIYSRFESELDCSNNNLKNNNDSFFVNNNNTSKQDASFQNLKSELNFRKNSVILEDLEEKKENNRQNKKQQEEEQEDMSEDDSMHKQYPKTLSCIRNTYLSQASEESINFQKQESI